MKIKTKILSGFLKKALMSGSQQVDEAILDFQEDGLKINANSKAKLARTMSWLKTNAFKKYDKLGKIGINELPLFTKVLDRFGEFIDASKEGNILTIKSEGKKVGIELLNEKFITEDTDDPSLEFTDTFNMTASKLGEIYKDVLLNKDASLIIETKEKKAVFSNTGKYKFANDIGAPTCKGGVKVEFGQSLIDATNALDGNLEVSVSTDYPIKVMEKTDNSVITLIVAPIVKNEDAGSIESDESETENNEVEENQEEENE